MQEKFGIIGAGTMGNRTAQTAAANGFEVVLCDIENAYIERGIAAVTKSLDRFVKKEKITEEDKTGILGRISTTTELSGLADCDLIIEAATENFGIKKQIFEDLEKIAKDGAILSSNTSSISITKIGAVTSRPENVIGMHFFNPVPLMKLVEVIRGIATSDETYAKVENISKLSVKCRLNVMIFPGLFQIECSCR
jgi:3-hydroxybutyryl-CoA dehydrogenase